MTISVIIITKNEEKNIGKCLKSVEWADEIIIVDSGSQDETLHICRQFTDKIYVTADWPGFGIQKNRALSFASCDWILSIDADEFISEQLRDEILSVINSAGKHTAYAIPRLSSYCGRLMHHGGWWPDYVVRLFLRESSKFSEDLVHERVITSGSTGRLKNHLRHVAFENLDEVIDTINRYSTAGAAMMKSKGKKSNLLSALAHGFWAFFQTYIIRAGFLDGREGFMLAVSNAEGTYYRYLKLMHLCERR